MSTSFRHLPRLAALALAASAALSSHALTYTWASGDFPGAGTPPPPALLAAGDTLDIVAGGTKRFVGGSFTNQGHVRWLADTLQGGNSASVANAGLWESLADTALTYNFGGQPTFSNTGTLRKSGGAGSTTIGNWSFVNDGGTVDAQTGLIDFEGASSQFNDGSRFMGAGSVRVRNSSSFAGNLWADNLQLTGGAQTGNAAVLAGGAGATAGAVRWTGGDLQGSWTFGAGTTLGAADGAAKRQVGGSIVNQGTFAWASGAAFQGGNGGTFTNHGLYDAQASHSITHNFGVAQTFSNAATGTVRAAAGVTLTVGGIALVSQGGTFDAEAGASIVYSGANARFDAGTTFSGAGTHRVDNNARFVGAISTANNLVLAGGTQTGGDGSPGSAALLGGNAAWTGGDWQGAWQINAGSTVAAGDGAAKRQVGGSIDNQGTLRWASTAAFQGGNSGTFANNGLYEATASHSITHNFGGAPVFANNATVRASGGATLSFGGVALVSQGGTFEATTGAAIVYGGGNATFRDGTSFIGAGSQTISSSARFIGTFVATAPLVLGGGAQTGGDGSVGSAGVLDGALTWTGGDLQGAWEIQAGSALGAADGAAKRQVGGSVVNRGTVSWGSTAAFQGGNSGSFTNQGLYEASASHSITHNFGGVPVFTNAAGATVRAGAGVELVIGGVALVSDGGRFDAAAGGVIRYNGGNARFNGGTLFTGAGQHVVGASSRFVGDFTAAANLTLAGGTATGGDAGLEGVLHGAAAWSGADLQGAWRIAAGSTLTAVDGAAKRQIGSAIVNAGTLRWTSADALQGGNASVFTNDGVFDLATDAGLTHNFGGIPTLVNNGRFVKSAGAGESSLAGIVVGNNGVMEVQSGTIRLPGTFANDGTLAGIGAFAASAITNHGHVAPGASTGTLTIGANFAQGAAGTYDVDIHSLASSDLLLVTGTAALAGTLALHCWGACSLAVGDELVILDSVGNLSGTFANVTLSNFATGAFDVVYDTVGERVLLQVTQAVTAVPEPATWAMWLLALAGGAALRRRR